MEVRSRFTSWVLLPIAMACSLGVFPVLVFTRDVGLFNNKLPLLVNVVICIGFLSLFLWVFVGELFNKAIYISINGFEISKRRFLGLLASKQYNLSDIDGFIIIDIPSKRRTYEYVYLVKDSRRLMIISEFYHSNYHDLKMEIIKGKVKNLGKEYWSFSKEIKRLL